MKLTTRQRIGALSAITKYSNSPSSLALMMEALDRVESEYDYPEATLRKAIQNEFTEPLASRIIKAIEKWS